MGSKIVLDLAHGRGNPRNSEGSFVTLADGRIMHAYSRYYGKSWSDHATADIAARYSDDEGRTWTAKDVILVKNEGDMNVMSASLLRLQDGRIALLYLRKNNASDCRPYLRTSRDEGRTWSKPTLCIRGRGYYVVNNDRLVQLRNGRLLVPASRHRTREDREDVWQRPGVVYFHFSDDGGRTWTEAIDSWMLPVKCATGLQEPGIVELKGGKLWCWCRTGTGRQWQMFSRDKGDTWTPPEPSRFRAPCSPLSMKRIPATGDLLAVWNDHSPRWKLPKKAKSSWARTPLAAAISSNEGKTWRKAKLIEKDPARGFCYIAVHFVADAVLLAYCCGGRKGTGVLQDSCVRRITLDWLYD